MLKLLLAIILIVPTYTLVIKERTDIPHSAARVWMDALLDAIRSDSGRPVVNSRTLFHTSAIMWDALAVYNPKVSNYFNVSKTNFEAVGKNSLEEAINETLSWAVYTFLNHRYKYSLNPTFCYVLFNKTMVDLGYDHAVKPTLDSAGNVGITIANVVITYSDKDNANELYKYAQNGSLSYFRPLNGYTDTRKSGLTNLNSPTHWQPLIVYNTSTGTLNQTFLGPHWSYVTPFSLTYNDFSFPPLVYFKPRPEPPTNVNFPQFKHSFTELVELSSHLDANDGVRVDIGPTKLGNNQLGTNNGQGYAINPITNQSYSTNFVKRGDYGRVLAEFWADGPSSETPPGHWNTIFNFVTDSAYGIHGDDLLTWDVKGYFTLNGALHDCAIAAWGIKIMYDSARPFSAVRFLGMSGQASDPNLPNYSPSGFYLVPGLIELITNETVQPGQRHAHLGVENINKIAIKSWLGYPSNLSEALGVGWILAANWLPYQRDNFITPPFAGYISGHSTFSRAAAEIMTLVTGSKFFPSGLGEFVIPKGSLVTEYGPSEDVTLTWATYFDASDQSGNSRLYGGIHIVEDDLAGRKIGSKIGKKAYALAKQYFDGLIDKRVA